MHLCLRLAVLFASATAAMGRPPIVQLMEKKAAQFGVLGHPLSHREIPGSPGHSWDEFLGCSDEAFNMELLSVGRFTNKLAVGGVFVTGMSLRRDNKPLQSVFSALGDSELFEPFLAGA